MARNILASYDFKTAITVQGLASFNANISAFGTSTFWANQQLSLAVRNGVNAVTNLVQYSKNDTTITGGITTNGLLWAGTTAAPTLGHSYSLSSAAYVSTSQATFTASTSRSTNPYAVGQKIIVAGVTGGTYNGSFIITAIGGSSGAWTATVTSPSGTTPFTNTSGTGGTGSIESAAFIKSLSEGSTPLTLQLAGASGTSTDFLRMYDGSNNLRTYFTGAGDLVAPAISATWSMTSSAQDVSVNAMRTRTSLASGYRANLQTWESSSTVLAGMTSAGKFFTGSTTGINTAVGGTIQSIATGANPLVTMASAHGLAIGDVVVLAGTTGGTYNGTFYVATVPLSTTFTITSALTTGQAAAGGTVSVGAQVAITARSSSVIGQVIRGAASQSADLLQIQDSAGNNNLSVSATYGLVGRNAGTLSFALSSANGLGAFYLQSPSQIGMIVRGAASQSASLQEWQNSAGTRLSSIASNGLLYLSSTSAANIDMYTEAANDMALMLPADDWDDKLRFLYGLYERSTDGTTGWTVNTFDTSIVDGRMDTVMSLPTASLGHRFTWYTTNFQYMTPKYLRLSSGYPGATSSTISVLIESSADNSTWTSRGSYTGISAGIMKRLLRVSDNGDHSYIRVTITYTAVVNAMQLENVELLTYRPGNQGGNLAGAESRLPISSWDGNRTSVIQASHSGAVSQIVKGGVVRTATINGAVGNGTTITFTTSTPHVLRVGQSVTITGVNPGAYNISGTIASVTGMSGFTITNAATGTYVSGGTATVTNLANPFEVHNAAGTTVARIDTTGTLVISGIGVTSGDHRVGTSSYFSAALNVLARTTTEKGLVVRGQASQTANLQEWQNSAGTVLSRIDLNGSISVPFLGSQVAGATYLQTNADTQSMTFFAGAAATKGIVVRGFASQSANLQEWQNSAGTATSSITASGLIQTSTGLSLTGINSPIVLNNSMGSFGDVLTSSGTASTPAWVSRTGSGNIVSATSPTFSTSIIGSASMDLFNTVSTTVNAFGIATSINLGTGAFSTLRTINIGSSATGTGNAQTINIGVNSTTTASNNINIGGTGASTTTITGILVAPLGKKVIQTVTLSGTSAISFTSIPATYRDLEIRILATTAVTTGTTLTLTVNGLTTTIYLTVHQWVNGVAPGTIAYSQQSGSASANLTPANFGAQANSYLSFKLTDYASSSFKAGSIVWLGGPSSGNYTHGFGNLFVKTTAAITQIDIAVGGTGGITGSAVLIGVY